MEARWDGGSREGTPEPLRRCRWAVLVLLVSSGCLPGASGRPLGESCSEAQPCDAPLICAYGRCRASCTFDRDCEPGTRCIASESSPLERACTLVEEAECGAEGDCPGELVCDEGRCVGFLESWGSLALALHFDETSGETAFDLAPPPNDGEVRGARRVDWHGAMALAFDGVDDVVAVTDLDRLRLTSSSTIVVRMEVTTDASQLVVGRRAPGGASNRGLCTQIHVSSRWINFQVSLDGTVDSGRYLNSAIPFEHATSCERPPCARLGEPLCVAGVLRSEEVLPSVFRHHAAIYLDGDLVYQHPLDGGPVNDPGETPFVVGRAEDGSLPFGGVVDAVLVFDEALLVTEVGQVCSALESRFPSPVTP